MRGTFIFIPLAVLLAAGCDNRNTANSSGDGAASSTPSSEVADADKQVAAAPAPSAAAPPSAGTFVEKAAIAGMFEVESSRIAIDRVNDPKLKEFAQMMVDDHTKAN